MNQQDGKGNLDDGLSTYNDPSYVGEERRQHTLPSIDKAIDVAVDRAVSRTFYLLGVDVHNPQSVEEFREDLRFGKKLRRIADRGSIAFIGAVGVALAAALWVGIVSKIKGG